MQGHPYPGERPEVHGRSRTTGRSRATSRSPTGRAGATGRSGARTGATARDGATGRSGARTGATARDGATGRSRAAPRPRSNERAGQLYRGQAPADVAGRAPRRRTPIWATLTVVIGAVLMLLSGTGLAGYGALHQRYAGVQQENLLGGAAVAAPPGEELSGPINMLLLGIDARQQDSDDVRSDAIMMLHVPSSHDQAYLISVPRDTWTSVPGYGEMKITEAFFHGSQGGGGWHGGSQLVAQSLHEMTGLRFNAAAIVNFGGFKKIIDEMGGIDYCVETAATSEHIVLVDGEPMGIGRARREGHWDHEPVRYEEGCQRMAGWQALDYVRQRKTLESEDGDYGRQRNQQQLLKAMMRQAASPDVRTNISTLDGLIRAAGDALIVDTNNVDLVDFVYTLRHLRPGDLVSMQTNQGQFNSANINGVSAEQLSPESLLMFQAAANDTMGQFVLNHADFVNQG